MQVCLRNAIGSSLSRSFIASSPRTSLELPQRLQGGQARRTYASGINPLDWVREKIAPQLRDKETKEEVRVAKKEAAAEGIQSIFDAIPKPVIEGKGEQLGVNARKASLPGKGKRKPKEHKYSTGAFRTSHRKLNLLANQISGKPIDWAILQMQFSEKRTSTRIMNMLVTAKDHALRYKHLDKSRLIVSEAWVNKGPRAGQSIDKKGRGRMGIVTNKSARMTVVLREGKTVQEKKAERREKILKRIVSPSIMREDMPLRNPAPTWCW